jgi:hypothetical protein
MRKPKGEVKAKLVRSVVALLCEQRRRIIVALQTGFGW